MVKRPFQLEDIAPEVNFVRMNETHRQYYGERRFQSTMKYPLLFISYEMPSMICFTRESLYISKSPRLYDSISFNFTAIEEYIIEDTNIQIFIHYPGQLMRSLEVPHFTSSWNNYNSKKNLEIKLSQVTVIRKRPDGNEPCNEEIDDYDSHLREYVSSEVGCIHPFWRKHLKARLNLSDCKLPEELKSVIEGVRNYPKIS